MNNHNLFYEIPVPCCHLWVINSTINNYIVNKFMYSHSQSKICHESFFDLSLHFQYISIKALACSSDASVKYVSIVESFIQGLVMLVLETRSCFKLRIIIAERRYEYLFVTNIFGHLFTFSRKTISHGFSFSGGHVTVIFRITVGGFCVLGKFIVTLFRVVFVFNCCLFSVLVFIASPVVLEASLPIGHKN